MDKITEKLRKIVEYAYINVPSYKEKMDNLGIKPSDIITIQDFQCLPFMEKDDFRKNYPQGMFAVPKDKIIRVHSTSGTTGLPSIVGFTKEDWERQAELTSKLGKMAGITEQDVVQIVYGFGMFIGGIGWLEGLERIGSLVIPTGTGNTKQQIEYLKQLKTTVLIGTPSYIMHLGECIKNSGINIKEDINIKKILVGGEIMTEKVRDVLKNQWNTDNVTQNYGFCEGGGAGISGECIYQNGMHIADNYYPEIIDSVTNKNLSLNSTGELVFTTLTKECVPLIRYRTKDITTLSYENCSCGISGYKMSTVVGRSDEMLKIKGICVFPSVIEKTILDNDFCSPNYEIVLETKNYLDVLNINIELNDSLQNYSNEELMQYKNYLKKQINETLHINVNIEFLEKNTIERSTGKVKRVKDLRLYRG